MSGEVKNTVIAENMNSSNLSSRWMARNPNLLVWLVLAVAAFVYAWRLDRTSLWLDEAWRANAVVSGDSNGMHRMPPLYYALLKLSYVLLGRSEWSFRLVSALAAIGTVLAVWQLAKRIFSSRVGLLAVLLASFCAPLVLAGREGKDYILAYMFCPMLCLLALNWIEKPGWRRCLLFAFAAVLGILTSYAVAFVAAAAQLVVLGRMATRSQLERNLVPLSLSALSILGVTGAAYFWITQSDVLHTDMLDNKDWSFPPPGTLGMLGWIVGQTWELLKALAMVDGTFFSTGYSVLVALCFAVGLMGRNESRQCLLQIVLVTTGFCAVAGSLHRWTYGGNRTMMFLIPMMLPVVANGLSDMTTRFKQARRSLAMAGVGCLMIVGIVLPGIWSLNVAVRRPSPYDFRSLAGKILPQFRSGDMLVLLPLAKDEFRFYCYSLPSDVRIKVMKPSSFSDIENLVKEAAPGRLWIMSSAWPSPALFEQSENQLCRQSTFYGGRCRADLFELRERSEKAEPVFSWTHLASR
jgi:4-amino-4-deoxy-L-arabinose transferase-like glycosyltransferase